MRTIILTLVLAAMLALTVGCANPSGRADDPLSGDAADNTAEIAVLYRDILSGMGEDALEGCVDLSPAQCGEIMDRLGNAGYSAFDYGRTLDMTNADSVKAFFSDTVKEKSLRLLEVCQDGGLLSHHISLGADDTLTLTRIAWEDGTPKTTYSRSYELTSVELKNGTVVYDYYWPENPEGTKHDGHVDTHEEIVLKHSNN